MKCVKCYREIDEHLKFCTYCGAKQPVDRAAYEREHPELAEALSDDELLEQQRQRQVMEAERLRQEAERKAQEEAERLRLEAERLRLETERLRLEAELKEKEETERKTREEVENNFIVCPNCGAKVSADVNFCSNCAYPIALQNKGSELHQDSTLPPPLTVVDTPPLPQMEPTPQQEEPSPQQVEFSSLQSQKKQEEFFLCPTCGAAVRGGAKACHSCGQELYWGDTPAPVQSTPVTNNKKSCCCMSETLLVIISCIIAFIIIIILLTKCNSSDSKTIDNYQDYGNIIGQASSYDSNNGYDYNYKQEAQLITDEANAEAEKAVAEAKAAADRAIAEVQVEMASTYDDYDSNENEYDDEDYDDGEYDEEESSY